MLLVITTVFLLQYPKANIHLFLNQYNSPLLDWFFRHITFLGDGLFLIIPALLLLFYSLRSSVYLVTAYLSSGLVVQILKRFLFEDCVRPSRYFADPSVLHLVNSVQLFSGYSFPSGHATGAFALFLCFAVICRHWYIQVACLFLACIVAYSRVYLSQHFLIDIVAGSLVGAVGALGLYLAFYGRDRRWHHWSLLKVFLHEKNS